MKNPFLQLNKYSPRVHDNGQVVVVNIPNITRFHPEKQLNDCGQWLGEWVTKIWFQSGYAVITQQKTDYIIEKINEYYRS